MAVEKLHWVLASEITYEHMGGPYLMEVVSDGDLRYIVGYLNRDHYTGSGNLAWYRELPQCEKAVDILSYCDQIIRVARLDHF